MKQFNFLSLLCLCYCGTLFAAPGNISAYLKIDQFGYLCTAKKVAVIVDPQSGYNAAEAFSPGTGAHQYQIRRWTDDVVVFTGTLQAWSGGTTHAQSGDRGWWFDFSTLTTAGSYYVYDVANNVGSYRFEIGDNVYQEVLKHAMRVFFYQRIGIAKTTAHSDVKWTDAAWYTGPNQDQAARSRWDKTNAATARDLSGGWFDAGDPNKYTTFAQNVILELLESYRMNPSVFADNYNIPESGNGVADLLDEVKWELDFFKKMQDATGTNGFFLKVGVDNFNTVSPPSLDTRPRYYVPECTSATLSGCAMFALSGVVYRALSNPTLQTYGNNLVSRAELAWARAQVTTNNFTTFETACDDQNVTSGDADASAAAQLQSAVIAAIYLYEATGNATYKTFVESRYTQVEPYSSTWWGPYHVGAQLALLRYASLSGVSATVANNIRNQKAAQNGVLSITDYNAQTDLYRSYMPDAQYHWGSNTVKATAGNHNLDFVTFNLNAGSQALYQEVAGEYLHYFHGLNPQGMVYLTNMYAYGAEKSANEIYHMWFDNGTDWDNAQTSPKGPAPGYVTGGANGSFPVTTISPPAGQPAQKAYKDWNTGWPENSWEITEPAIYTQASYIRLLSRVIALGSSCSVVTAPAAPSVLTASTVSHTQINLSWTDNTNNETAYKVERATAAAGPWTELTGTLPANTTSYSATGLTASTTYYFRVRAANSAGNSGYSNTANATTNAAPTVPNTPSSLAASTISTSQINLTWTDNANNETAYKVERATAAAGPWTEIAGALAANTTSYSATGLSASTTYYFRVRASNAVGNSGYSNAANATTNAAPTVPNAPSSLAASTVSTSQINLSWTDNANNETAYKVERATAAAGPWTEIAGALAANTTSYSATGLSASTTYYFRVRASNAIGNSGYSNTANATTAAPSTVTTQVYTDALQTDWADWSWSVANNFANTTPVRVGSRSLSVNYSSAWSGLSLRKGTAHPSNNLTEVRFWVYAASALTLNFYIQTTDGGASSTNVAFTTNANQWKEIVVTRAQLGNPTAIKRLNFQAGNFTGTVYYDEVRLINSGAPQLRPQMNVSELAVTNAPLEQTIPTRSELIQNLLAYPNPSAGAFTLAFEYLGSEAEETPTQLQVFELATGRVVLSQKLNLLKGQNTVPLQLEHLAAGAYYVRLFSHEKSFTTRLLIQR